VALVHPGTLKHGAGALVQGERMNLILWMDCPAKFEYFSKLPTTITFEVFSYLSCYELSSVVSTSKIYLKYREDTEFWNFYTEKIQNSDFRAPKSLTLSNYLQNLGTKENILLADKIRRHYIARNLMTSFSKYSVQENVEDDIYSVKNLDAEKKAKELLKDPQLKKKIRSIVAMNEHRKRDVPFFFPL